MQHSLRLKLGGKFRMQCSALHLYISFKILLQFTTPQKQQVQIQFFLKDTKPGNHIIHSSYQDMLSKRVVSEKSCVGLQAILTALY